MYNTYVSLGSNCEAGFQFKRIGYDESSFFRWTLSPYSSTYNLIKNDFQNLYLKENLVPVWNNMVEDHQYRISFHSHLLSKQNDQTGKRYFLTDYDFDKIYQEEYQKIQYFVNKWNSLVNSDKNVLYIIKEERHGSKSNAEKLLNLFKQKYPNHKFAIAYIQGQDKYEPDWGLDQLKNIYFPRFAPISQADDADTAAWDDLFNRFPLI